LGFAYGLVHQTKGNSGVALVLGRDLRPKAGELGVCRSALSNNTTVPTGVVVDVDNAECSTGVQAALDQLVVRGPVVGVEGAAKVVVEQKLPSDWKAECVQAIVLDEMLDLVNVGGLAGSVDGATKVEAGDLVEIDG
jgi:hypothetical protein